MRGTINREQAKIVEVKLGQKIKLLDFQLTNKLIPHYIRGVVNFVDGKPASDVSITLIDVNRPHYCVNGCDLRTDSQGKFVLTGYEGYTYKVSAYDLSKDYNKYKQKTILNPSSFELKKDINDLKVILQVEPKETEP